MRKGSRGAYVWLALCTAAATLTGCGGSARDGYVAVGAAAPGPERGAGENVAPRGEVEFQPLAAPPAAAGSSASAITSPSAPGASAPAGSTRGGAAPAAPGDTASAPGITPGPGSPSSPGGSGAGPGTTTPGTTTPGTTHPGTTPPGTTPPGTTAPPRPPATPAKLTLSTPTRTAAADRWCERVTVTFTNTGTTAARSGTVTFSTHIIGILGGDWGTRTTTQPLPAPIAGGTAKTQTYTVCVDDWRVLLGMHVETRTVTATWS
ncbi:MULTISPECIES: hypothetical protein [unclassified Streptomyces]|uniref:hypothetical protein n=1 Tax=unclassified Streptomyces TaxID=2593676 RepID=UPI001BEC55D5|nr:MULTISPECIES: hypothetical protein [unclassified Streptomyces]MBT2404151.1 hypothetical protein [Streptomyces sp. ISL-21]MBT2607167.1 hypothetical protein [Streptomyces sp. ISL-87]